MTTFSEQFPIVFQALNIGFLQTLKLFFVTLIGAIPLGLIISFGSMSNWAPLGFLRPLLKNLPKNAKLTWWQRFQIWSYVDFKPIRIIVRFIIWVVRGTPLMLQLLVFYYFPGLVLGRNIWGSGEAGRFLASSIAFIFNYACYFSEIFRGGIQGVPKGQQEAGQVLGMTSTQIFFKVTLLQMVKRIVPPMSNEIITLVKDTSLSRIIALQEIIWAGQAFLKGSQGISGAIWPSSGTVRKLRQRSSVVLPLPDEPMMATVSPFSREKSTPLRTTVSLPKLFFRFLTSRTDMGPPPYALK